MIVRPKPFREIPENAKLVFKGVIHDVYQWQQEMFDGSFATFETLKRPDTVNIIPITEDGKIILLKQSQPGRAEFVGIAGGRVDPGEEVLDAANRELLEETGYKCQKLELWYASQPAGNADWAVFTFIARNCQKTSAQHLDAGEKIEMELVDFSQFIESALSDDFRDTEVQIKIAKILLQKDGREKLRKLFSN